MELKASIIIKELYRIHSMQGVPLATIISAMYKNVCHICKLKMTSFKTPYGVMKENIASENHNCKSILLLLLFT